MPSLELFAERMRYWCDEGNLGYDQTNRYDVRVGGESDCSWLLIFSLKEAGFDTGNANSTHDLSYYLTQHGWVRLPPDISTARKGDILLNDANHVAAVIYGWGWWSTIAEAWLDEKGGIYYGESGDQTGLETRTRGIYDFPWNCILRYMGETEEEVSASELWGYKNKGMNGDRDAYQMMTDMWVALCGPQDKCTSSLAYMNKGLEKVDVYQIVRDGRDYSKKAWEAVTGVRDAVAGMSAGNVDVNMLAEAVADKLASRMAD